MGNKEALVTYNLIPSQVTKRAQQLLQLKLDSTLVAFQSQFLQFDVIIFSEEQMKGTTVLPKMFSPGLISPLNHMSNCA